MAIELELKLMVQSEYLKSVSDFLDEICMLSPDSQSRQPTLSLMNGYFDTEESLLMQSGVALRIRAVNDQFIQTVKTRGSDRIGMHARGEWEWPLPNESLDLGLLKDVPLPEALKNLSWGRDLIEVFRTDFERQVWNIEDHDTKMEVVCDKGKVTSPYGEDDICELELELKQGDESGLYRFALKLAQTVPVQVSIVSKAQKGARLKHGQIEFPKSPMSQANNLELAAYWYQVWLVYWEAMFFMKDGVLIQPIIHSIGQLGRCLPEKLRQNLLDLHVELEKVQRLDDDEILPMLASTISVGIAMLNIGQWLNKQSTIAVT